MGTPANDVTDRRARTAGQYDVAQDLIVQRPQGLYCPAGDFYIDPWRSVDRAVITHAHADHARRGHRHYLAHAASEGVLRARLGANITLQPLAYGEVVDHHGVRVSLHPAGHVLGSAQVRVEHAGQVWVASGDYKLDADPTCAPFEPVRCDVFITESTFGLPIYRWPDPAEVFAALNAWWARNAAAGRTSVVYAYSLGKAQRVLSGIDAGIGPVLVHRSLQAVNAAYAAAGVALPATQALDDPALSEAACARALVLTPPGAGQAGMERLCAPSDAYASGWMAVRALRRRSPADRAFVLSDHADWPGLQRAIRATGAPRVIVTHGSEDAMVRWLCEQGLQAGRFRTRFGQGEEEAGRAVEATA